MSIYFFEIYSIKLIVILKHFASVWLEQLTWINVETFILKIFNEIVNNF